MKLLPLLLATLVLAPVLATAQDRCVARYESERARIERELARDAPKASDREAYQRWSQRLHDLLKAAADEAEACTRASRPAPAPQAVAAQQACLDGVHRAGDDIARRYGQRTLSPSEQAARRAEEEKLLDQRRACTQPRR